MRFIVGNACALKPTLCRRPMNPTSMPPLRTLSGRYLCAMTVVTTTGRRLRWWRQRRRVRRACVARMPTRRRITKPARVPAPVRRTVLAGPFENDAKITMIKSITKHYNDYAVISKYDTHNIIEAILSGNLKLT